MPLHIKWKKKYDVVVVDNIVTTACVCVVIDENESP